VYSIFVQDTFEQRAEEFLSIELETQNCAWCQFREVRSAGLCRHCSDVRRALKNLYKRVLAVNESFGNKWPRTAEHFKLELDFKTAIVMAASAQVLGGRYRRLMQYASTLDCEREFTDLSKRVVKRNKLSYDASLFEAFSPVHRRLLLALIGRLLQTAYSRNRRKDAVMRVSERRMEQVLAERAHGTYRVEADYLHL